MKLILLIAAAICFGLAAFRVPGPVDWVPAGYCFVVVAFIV